MSQSFLLVWVKVETGLGVFIVLSVLRDHLPRAVLCSSRSRRAGVTSDPLLLCLAWEGFSAGLELLLLESRGLRNKD